MTTTRMQRCSHCQEVYPYHPSTYGFMPRYNDDRFCPSCAEVIEKALKPIPVKYVKKFVKTKDYTREQIVNAQEERCSKPPAPGVISFPALRRVMPGLFDMKDPSNRHNQVLEMMPDPVTGNRQYYLAEWWLSVVAVNLSKSKETYGNKNE